jgi:hypothetical protein
MPRLALLCTALAIIWPHTAAGQAWGLPAHTGEVTFVGQEIDHVGRMFDDGSRVPVGKAVNLGLDVEVDYAFTDRWSISTSLPFVVSKYTDPNPPPPFLPFPAVDSCRCWRSEFADFGLTSRHTVIDVNRTFVLTPFVAVGIPSHRYDYVGEAVVGRRLTELRVGADAGQRLDKLLPGVSLQADYEYTVVRRVLDIPNNRSNGSASGSIALTRAVAVQGILTWQRTHGGLRFPDDVCDAICMQDPAHAPQPERLTEFHRMLRDNYLHTGAGMSVSTGAWDISASFLLTARGSNSHDIHVFSVTAGRSFEIHKRRG